MHCVLFVFLCGFPAVRSSSTLPPSPNAVSRLSLGAWPSLGGGMGGGCPPGRASMRTLVGLCLREPASVGSSLMCQKSVSNRPRGLQGQSSPATALDEGAGSLVGDPLLPPVQGPH